MQIWPLGQEDPLEKIQSSILTFETPWMEKPGCYSPWGHKRVGHDWSTRQGCICEPQSPQFIDHSQTHTSSPDLIIEDCPLDISIYIYISRPVN